MAQESEKALFFGNKQLIVYLRGASIKYIGNLCGDSLCTFDYNEDINSIEYSANEGVITIEEMSDVVPVQETIHFFDYISSDKSIFIRNISAMRRSSFKILPASGTHMSYIENFYIGSCPIKCIVISSLKNQKRLYIGLVGDFRYTPDTSRVWFEFGYSDIIFSYGTPDEAVSNLKSAYKSIEYENPLEPQPQNKIYLRTHLNALKHLDMLAYPYEKSRFVFHYYKDICKLYERFADLALVLKSPSGAYITEDPSQKLHRLDKMLSLVPALITTGYKEHAKDIINFAISIYKKHNCLPLMVDVYGSEIVACDMDFITCLLALNAVLSFCEKTDDHTILSDNIDFTDNIIKHIYSKVVCGALPFTGYEGCFDDEDISTTIRFQGSAENTLKYIIAIDKYLSITEKYNIKIKNREIVTKELDIARNNYYKNFFSNDGIAINLPKREGQIKHPHFTYGRCDMCYIKERERWSIKSKLSEGWIERNKAGFYTCPDCFSETMSSRFLVCKSDVRFYNTEVLLDNYNNCLDKTYTLKLINFVKYRVDNIKKLSLTEMIKALPFISVIMPERFAEFIDAIIEKTEDENAGMEKLALFIETIDRLSKT